MNNLILVICSTRFIESLKSMIRGAKIGLFFFDASHLASLDSLYNYWIPIAQEHSNFDFTIDDGGRFILVANKIDLLEGNFQQLDNEMTRFCERFGTESALISERLEWGLNNSILNSEKSVINTCETTFTAPHIFY